MKIQTETDISLLDEIRAIAQQHWAELAEDRDLYELDVDEDLYRGAHARGILQATTVRDDNGVLIAYHVIGVRRHPHRKTLMSSDFVSFVRPNLPNRVWILLAMYRHSRDSLIAQGVKYLCFRVKLKRDFGPMLRRLGFEPLEMAYALTVRDADVQKSHP